MSDSRLIVHGDDFGLSHKVNQGILRAHCDGILTSTSVLANGAAFEEAMALSREVPTLDLGIHLTLTEEWPVLPRDAIASLVDTQGRFYNHAMTFIKRYISGQISVEEIRRELDAQVRKVLSHGVPVSHLDGHQHIHMLPAIRRITIELAKEYAIPAVRLPRERLQAYMFVEKRFCLRLLPLLALNVLCVLGTNLEVLRADHFVGFLFGGRLNRKNMKTVLEHLPYLHEDSSDVFTQET